VVYARTIGDATFSFIVSGKLWRNSLIMQDRETNSLWSHITGEAMEGEMKGKRLGYLPAVQTTWSEWVKVHPETRVLKKNREIRSSAYEDYFKDPNRIGIFRSSWLMDQLPGKSIVHGIARVPHATAITDKKLEAGRIHNIVVGDHPVVVLRSANGGIRAFERKAGGVTLHFHRGGTAGEIRDEETCSAWDLETGRCTAGEFEGTNLEEVTVRTAFWFAWSNFYPNTRLVK
jgi:hypothetical protein